jgi:GNAT superfamily N-acetyltransferase
LTVLGGGTPWPVDTSNVIRPGVPADLPAVRDVYRSASLSNAGDRAVLLAHPEHLILGPEGLNGGRTQVAEEDGSVVGFATWTQAGGVTELEDLFVDPGWRRRGIATALVKGIAEVLRARGVERLEVTANPHAMGFYTAIGFARSGVVSTEFSEAPRMVLAIH